MNLEGRRKSSEGQRSTPSQSTASEEPAEQDHASAAADAADCGNETTVHARQLNEGVKCSLLLSTPRVCVVTARDCGSTCLGALFAGTFPHDRGDA